jgi:hypothetical protein
VILDGGDSAFPPPRLRAMKFSFGWFRRGRSIACAVIFAAVTSAAWAQSFTVTPSSITFPNRPIGTFSLLQSIYVTNTGTTNLILSSYSLSPLEFQLETGHAPQTMLPGTQARFDLRFAPDASQTFSGSFTVNVHGAAPVSVPITGTGISTGASVSVNRTRLDFGNEAAGTTSNPQVVSVKNVGTSNLTVTGITLDPPFELGGFTKPTLLTAGSALSFQVSLVGTLPAYHTNSATVNYDVLPPSGLSLSGTVTAAAVLGITNFPTLASATVDSPYLAALTAAGGVPPYTWALSAGSALPAGLSLSSDGQISGTLGPGVTVGSYSFSVQVQDSGSPPGVASENVTLPVAAPTGASCGNISSNVPNTSSPLIAVTDLGTGTYQGQQGGLYPNGSNVRPSAHNSAGIAISHAIQPLDSNGNPDPNGKYALLSLGVSPAFDTWLQLVPDATADHSINPHLVFVSGAQPGAYASRLADPNDPFWNPIFQNFLPQAGVTGNQVVAVWLHDVDATPSGTFPTDMAAMQSEYQTIAQNLHAKFPNLKLMYLNSSIYSGYSPGNCPEPYAYETAFAVKWAIQQQIDGLPALNYNPKKGPVMAPWMSWASYDWANGLMARNDGLAWACAEITSDGCHPSNSAGREKESNLLLNFFKSDSTTTFWFLAH